MDHADLISTISLIEPLTDRELDVLRLMAEDLTVQAMADRLVLSSTTVKWYTQQIYGKLGGIHAPGQKRRQAVGERPERAVELAALVHHHQAAEYEFKMYAGKLLAELEATRVPTVEVVHEALIHRWERLHEWIDASRADIRQQRLLAAAAEWV
jgi:DNA-binding CsgD family transcriptional regulator